MKNDNNIAPRQWFSAPELVGLRGLPGSLFGIMKKAEREAWSHRKREARGGGKEYPISALPPEARDALLQQILSSAPALLPAASGYSSPVVARPVEQSAPGAVFSSEDLTDRQREVKAARAAIVAEVRRIGGAIGSTRKAVQKVADLAAAGTLPEHLQALVPVANARIGKCARAVSRGTIYQWMRRDADGELAPRKPGRDYTLAEDVAAVLATYRQANKPTLKWCSDEVGKALGLDDRAIRALYLRASRFKEKLPSPLFHVGRHTGAALKALQPFRRRDFRSLNPNDVWTGDGHTCKFKVAHPGTGSPFAPEATLTMDVACRHVVGWSVSLSENCIAVSDSLRHGVARHGVPLIYYSDGGAGQANKMLDAPITGILGALGIHHEVGRPGNPQGRGLIERLWQTVTIPLARRFATFQGRGADRDTLRNVSREIDQQLRAAKRGEVVELPRKLPNWQQFIGGLDQAIEQYNTTHRHRSLPKLDGVNHATPAEYRAHLLATRDVQIHKPDQGELATLFMPAVLRTAARGEVRLWNGIYYHRDLHELTTDADKLEVKVHYDIHDERTVRVCRKTGELIAEAVLDGNRGDYFPKPLIQRLKEGRAQRRRGLLEAKIAEVDAELAGTVQLNGVELEPLEIPAPVAEENPVSGYGAGVVALPGSERPFFETDAEKYRWLLAHPGLSNDDDTQWLASYRATDEWADLFGHEKGTAARA